MDSFETNFFKKDVNLEENIKDHGLPYPKVAVDVFCSGCGCPLMLPGGVSHVKSCTRHTFPITEKQATWLAMLPPCLTRWKAIFHSVMLSWNPCAVRILYTSTHSALPPKVKFYKTISYFVPFSWIAASMGHILIRFDKAWCYLWIPSRFLQKI